MFWAKFVKHRFLCFCRAHHERLRRLGCDSANFQFFPEPGPERHRAIDVEALDAFFWQRRPRTFINVGAVAACCRALGVKGLHVHDVPDFLAEQPPHMRIEDDLEVSVSGWFERREDYAATAGRPLFFFAPRPMEGIGMASLEAMARGQIVVAPDLPTTNEYVAHLSSGLLYDPAVAEAGGHLPRLSAERLRSLSRAARRKIVDGRRAWLKDTERVRSIIADDGRRWSTTDYSAHFARTIRRAAHERLRYVR